MPVHILLSKINHPIAFSYQRSALHATPRKADHGCLKAVLVGLGRVELPTSPLSGVRSSHLSYRPSGLPCLVELVGIEPATSCLQSRRSPS